MHVGDGQHDGRGQLRGLRRPGLAPEHVARRRQAELAGAAHLDLGGEGGGRWGCLLESCQRKAPAGRDVSFPWELCPEWGTGQWYDMRELAWYGRCARGPEISKQG